MAEDKDPFAEFGGKQTTVVSDPFAEFGGAELKKKETTIPNQSVTTTTSSSEAASPSTTNGEKIDPTQYQWSNSIQPVNLKTGTEGVSPSPIQEVGTKLHEKNTLLSKAKEHKDVISLVDYYPFMKDVNDISKRLNEIGKPQTAQQVQEHNALVEQYNKIRETPISQYEQKDAPVVANVTDNFGNSQNIKLIDDIGAHRKMLRQDTPALKGVKTVGEMLDTQGKSLKEFNDIVPQIKQADDQLKERIGEFKKSTGYTDGQMGFWESFANSASRSLDNSMTYLLPEKQQAQHWKERAIEEEIAPKEPKGALGALGDVAGGLSPYVGAGILTGGGSGLVGLGANVLAQGLLGGTSAGGETGYETYKKLIDSGVNEQEALQQAHKLANFNAATSGLAFGGLGLLGGGSIGDAATKGMYEGLGGKGAEKTAMDAVIGKLKDASIAPLIFGADKTMNNLWANYNGIKKDWSEGVAENMMFPVLLHATMGALTGGQKFVGKAGKEAYDTYTTFIAKSDPKSLSKIVDNAIKSGLIDNAYAEKLMTDVKDKAEVISQMPNLPFDKLQEGIPAMKNWMLAKQQLEKATKDKSPFLAQAVELEREASRKVHETLGTPLTAEEETAHKELKAQSKDAEKPLSPLQKEEMAHYEKRKELIVKEKEITDEAKVEKKKEGHAEPRVLQEEKLNFTTPENADKIKEQALGMKNPILLFKGKDGKINLLGGKTHAHPDVKGIFMSPDMRGGERYDRGSGVDVYLADGTTEVVKVPNNTPFSDIRKVETELVNKSKADIVYLDTVDAYGKERQVVVKNPDALKIVGHKSNKGDFKLSEESGRETPQQGSSIGDVGWRVEYHKSDAYRKSDILRAIADESKSEKELDDVVNMAVKGAPNESLIMWAVANNPNSSKETFEKAVSNKALRKSTTEENIQSLREKRFGGSSIGGIKALSSVEETAKALEKKGGKEISKEEFNDKLLDLATLDLEDSQVKYPKIEGRKQGDVGSGKGYNLYVLDRDKLPESGAFEISIQDDNGEPIGFIRGTKGGKIISFNLIHINEENRGKGIGTDIYEKLLDEGYIIKSDKEITDDTYSLYDRLEKSGYKPLLFKDGTVGLVKAVESLIGKPKEEPVKVAGTEVVEHGEDTNTAKGLDNGIKPTELTEEGKKEAEQLGEKVKAEGKTKIVTSDVERAKETGKIASEISGVEHEVNKNLNTWNIGEFDGKPEGEFDEKYYVEHPDEKPEGGESFNDFKSRMEKAYAEVKAMPKENQVVAHSKVQKAFKVLEKTDGKWTDETTKEYLKGAKSIEEPIKKLEQELSSAKEEHSKAKDIVDANIKGQKEIPLQVKGADKIARGLDKLNTIIGGKLDLIGEERPQLIDALKDIGEGLIESGQATLENVVQKIREYLGAKMTDEDFDSVKDDLKKELGIGEEKKPQNITSIKNEVTDKKREELGLSPAMQQARKSNQTIWDNAMAIIEKNPNAPNELIEQIQSGKKKSLTDEENALLLHKQIGLETERQNLENESDKAIENGDKELIEENKSRIARVRDELQNVYDASKIVGTEWGRSGQFRQQLAKEDYSLASLERQKRASLGRPLTDAEAKEIKDLHEKIQAKQKEFDDYVAKAEERLKEAQAKQVVERIVHESKKQKRAYTRIELKKERDVIISDIKSKLKAHKPSGTLSIASNIPVEILPDIAKLTKNYVQDGYTRLQDLVDAIHGDLDGVYDKRAVRDAISRYGYEPEKKTKSELQKQIEDLKKEAKQLSKGEDMQGGKIDPANLKSFKTRTANRIKELQEKLAKGDFSKEERKPLQLDQQAIKLKAELERTKNEFAKGLERDRLAKRTPMEKAQDALVKWERNIKLSGITTLAKLTAAAMERVAITPAEEAVGGIISKFIPKIASKAEREGGFNIRAESKAITQGFTKGVEDAWETLTMKESDIENVFGKKGKLPPEAADFFGHLHGALKSIPKRAEFERSFEKRIASKMAKGVDVSDPMIQTQTAVDAYKDANRAIFMQDNKFASAFTNMMHHFEMPDKKTGETPTKWVSTVGKILLPFVKVPTNIIGETITYSTGSVTGATKLAKAMYRGIENTSPEESDMILRHFKKGSLGLGFMLLGYFNPQSVGGYYQKYEKRRDGEAEAGGLKLYGQDIPKWMVHNPLLEQLQIGATIRRVSDSYIHKSHDKKGIGNGVMAASLGLADEVPFIKTGSMITGAMENEKSMDYFLGELAKNNTDPALLQDIARYMDKDSKGEPVKRSPETIWQHIETGIPFLRESVKEKKKKGGKATTPKYNEQGNLIE